MSLFGRYDEEEFLDEDEKRLRRESARRSREAHSKCAADHADDGRYQSPTNPKPHNDCKADHSDDGTKAHTAPNYGNTTRPNGYSNPNPNAPRPNNPYKKTQNNTSSIIAVVIVLVTFMAFLTTLITATSNARTRNHTNPTIDLDRMSSIKESLEAQSSNIMESAESRQSEIQGNFNMTQFAAIEEYINQNHCSRSEAIAYFAGNNMPEEHIEAMILSIESLNRVNFGENAVYVVTTEYELEEGETYDAQRVREILESHGFVEKDIEYVFTTLEIE